ncbi:MAG: gliding motility lipoprotein GldH [Chlorobi bacterium]|nr:gliding motility lipoprotein GldH [Chlorobiota bacterium]
MKYIKSTLITNALITLFWACQFFSSGYVYFQWHDIPGHTWRLHDTLTFNIVVSDTSRTFDLVITVSATDDYQWRNLITQMIVEYPDGYKEQRLLNLPLSSDEGFWYGRKVSGFHEIEIPIGEIKFPKEGTYSFRLFHWMRENEVKGIARIGLALKPVFKTQNRE